MCAPPTSRAERNPAEKRDPVHAKGEADVPCEGVSDDNDAVGHEQCAADALYHAVPPTVNAVDCGATAHTTATLR